MLWSTLFFARCLPCLLASFPKASEPRVAKAQNARGLQSPGLTFQLSLKDVAPRTKPVLFFCRVSLRGGVPTRGSYSSRIPLNLWWPSRVYGGAFGRRKPNLVRDWARVTTVGSRHLVAVPTETVVLRRCNRKPSRCAFNYAAASHGACRLLSPR